ncbi:CarD family transcriptional regulator [Aurantimonas sp. 22II-16-19i]|uniref:CarD family transcriptional regulator n=1 Tax=Aurantimonas sp. 22II-16-19i TaxID=1317114 RepID=UPI00111C7B53|nr:CarD family transcriptional regulator [Aurantimonas sp. 22II-16-19i]
MFRIGEPVIHRDHGIGLLEGIEEIALPEGTPHDALRLCYEGDATLMVPAHRDRGTVELWRRRLRRDARPAEGRALGERRAKLDRAIRTTAEKLVDAVHDRHARKAPKLVPETARFERLAARFGHVLTPDQAAAIDAVLADLSSGRRVDRLVCERTKAPRLESRSG